MAWVDKWILGPGNTARGPSGESMILGPDYDKNGTIKIAEGIAAVHF